MRRFCFCLALALSAALAPAVSAEPKPGAQSARTPAAEKARRPASLDDLFTRLSAAKDEAEANGVANLIERRWSRSGSDTADLLMSRAGDAIQAKDHALAIELLDRVVTLKPEWAEGWNKRATAFFMMDDPVSSIADIRQVLTREPRHFGAWAGLGHIYMSGGDKKHALEAYRKALAIHPYLAKLKEIVERLTPEIDGRDI
jgi:tetratricopeptide (TPR) repeat protein